MNSITLESSFIYIIFFIDEIHYILFIHWHTFRIVGSVEAVFN